MIPENLVCPVATTPRKANIILRRLKMFFRSGQPPGAGNRYEAEETIAAPPSANGTDKNYAWVKGCPAGGRAARAAGRIYNNYK
jgi:hypothetical protein